MVIEFRARPNYEMRIRRVEPQDLTTSDFQELSVEQDEEGSVPKIAFLHRPSVPPFTMVFSGNRQKFDEASKAVRQFSSVPEASPQPERAQHPC